MNQVQKGLSMTATSGEEGFKCWEKLQDLCENKILLRFVAISHVSNHKFTIMRIYLHFRKFLDIFFIFWFLFHSSQEHGREVGVWVDRKRDPTCCPEVRLQSWGPI